MPAWTIPYSKSGECRHILKSMTIIVLHNFRYKKLSKLCIQLLRYKQPVPYLSVNASMDNTILKKWSVSNAGIYEKYFISDTRNFLNHVYN